MSLYGRSDLNLLTELGASLKALRLSRNITQEELAKRCLLSVSTIKALETGKAKLSTLVAVLRELGRLDDLAPLLAAPPPSPLELAKNAKPARQRARGRSQEPETW